MGYPKNVSPVRKPLDEGSPHRYVSFYGCTAKATSVSDAAASTLTVGVAQPGILGKLILTTNAAVALVAAAGQNTGILVTSIKVNNQELIGTGTGYVPAELFCRDSVSNPYLGLRVEPNDAVTVSIQNESGATIEWECAFTAF